MTKFLVERTIVAETEIEADNEEEAFELAKDLSISEFDFVTSITEELFLIDHTGKILEWISLS